MTKKSLPDTLLDTVCSAIDELLTAKEITMVIHSAPGTQETKIAGTGISTIDFFILLNSMKPVFRELLKDLGGTEPGKEERLVDKLLGLLRRDLLEIAREGQPDADADDVSEAAT